MTEEIYAESLSKILRAKRELEEHFNIEITNRGKLIFINSEDPMNEFLAVKAIDALNMGLPLENVISLKDEDFAFEKIPIKSITKRTNIREVRGRLIGVNRSSLDMIENISDCALCVHDSTVGIIGRLEKLEDARQAIKSLIQGSKHTSVYSKLERRKKEKADKE